MGTLKPAVKEDDLNAKTDKTPEKTNQHMQHVEKDQKNRT